MSQVVGTSFSSGWINANFITQVQQLFWNFTFTGCFWKKANAEAGAWSWENCRWRGQGPFKQCLKKLHNWRGMASLSINKIFHGHTGCFNLQDLSNFRLHVFVLFVFCDKLEQKHLPFCDKNIVFFVKHMFFISNKNLNKNLRQKSQTNIAN